MNNFLVCLLESLEIIENERVQASALIRARYQASRKAFFSKQTKLLNMQKTTLRRKKFHSTIFLAGHPELKLGH